MSHPRLQTTVQMNHQMRTISQEMAAITLGEPVYFSGLTVFPLFREGCVPPEPGYTLLEDAVARGSARVTEIGDGGSVPELRFENLGEKPVLLLDGEELIGAKQNRVVNLTILAPAKQTIVLPVSCVEAGRWNAESEVFRPAEHVMYSRARAAKAAQISSAMAASDTRRSDQSAIWDEIALKSARLGADSPTQAMNAMYDVNAVSLHAYLRAFAWTEREAGVAFAVGPGVMGLDLMDHPKTLQAMFPKLVRSYALDALEAPHSPAATGSEIAQLLARIGKADCPARPAVGIGEDIRLTGNGISGAALWAEGYVHVCAFTVDGNAGPQQFHTRISRPTRRRREQPRQ
jgi:ARG and Rhodanese-Phosphatase-superfamily-associated Protein domain